MYIDTVVVASVVTVVGIIGMMAYWGLYAYRHIQKDIHDHPGEE